MLNQHILMDGTAWGTDWIYLLFVIGISVLSWLGNLVKKHREGEAGDILHPEDVTDVEEVFDEEPEPSRQPQRPVAPSTPFRPVSPPPLAQPVQSPPVPPRPVAHPMPPGPAVVLPRLAQMRPRPTQSAAEAVLHPKAAPKSLSPAAAKVNLLDRKALRRAIVMAEILDRPIALRPGRTADSF